MAKTQKTMKKQGSKAPSKMPAASDTPTEAKKATASTPPKQAKEGSRVDRSKVFLRDVRGEMKRVTWPSRSQLLKSTGAVLLAIIILGTYIGLLDWGFRSGASALGL